MARKHHCSLPGGQSTKGAHCHDVSGRSPPNVGEGLRQRTVCVQLIVWHHHGESSRYAKVGEEADEQRGYNANWNGAHWVLSLLT